MPFDAHKNLAITVVQSAPVPPDSGTQLTVPTGHGARFPSPPPFNCTVWLSTSYPDPTNAELVRVTAVAGDTLTLLRAQEGTTARAIIPGDLIALALSAKTLIDIETAIGTTPSPPTLHATTHEVGGSDQITGALSLTTLTASESILAGASVFADLDVVLNGLGVIGWQGRAWFNAPAAGGVITLLNGAFDNFSRLQFGGTTAAFPALRRNSTGLDVVTADASAFSSLIALDLTAANGQVKLAFGGVTIKQGAGSPEGVVPLAVGSLFLRDNGGTGTTLYVKETGAATSTGWTAMVSGGGAPAAHRLTHETGGADALQNLSAAILTSGSLPFARVPISAASRLLGRGSAGGAGAMQELTLGTGLTMTGTVLSSSGAGADEVSVGATDPGATYELWYDTAAVSPTTNYALLNTANTFTQSQTITGNLSVSGDVIPAGSIRKSVTTSLLTLSGGSDIGTSAYINIFGSAYAGAAGHLDLMAMGTGRLSLGTAGAARGFVHPSGGFSWGSSTDPGAGNLSVAGELTLAKAGQNNLTLATNDGADTGFLKLGGGGTPPTHLRGGWIGLFGNEVGTAEGLVQVAAGDAAAGKIEFMTGPGTVRGVMHRSGGFSWGGTTTDPGAGVLFVGNTSFLGGQPFVSINPNGTVSIGAPATTAYNVGAFVNANGFVGYIQTSGTTTAFLTTSDARLKTDRGRLTDTSVLERTIVHVFDWKVDGAAGRGVFAQEAAAVAPFAVSIGTDERDEQGLLKNPWGVDYAKYVPDLIVGWQQHEATIAALRAEVAALQVARYGTSSPSQTLGGWPMAMVGWVRDLFRARQKERRCLT